MLFSGLLVSQDQTADDILFLKIQELEEEIAFLRSELESQAYLLEKLQNEDLENAEQSSSNDNDSQAFRFEGINDDETIDELYQKGINSLNLNELDAAEEAFSKLVENYSDEEKLPLSLFWLGEISLISLKYENSKDYFLSLVSQFPDHWRSPLAHKKIGDFIFHKVLMMRQKKNINMLQIHTRKYCSIFSLADLGKYGIIASFIL